jgi:DNA-binding transcriptional MerR regulator
LAEALSSLVKSTDQLLLQQFVNEMTKQGCTLSQISLLQKTANLQIKDSACQTYEGFFEQKKQRYHDEDEDLRAQLNEVEVELQAKNSMVEARENTINELRDTLDAIKAG